MTGKRVVSNQFLGKICKETWKLIGELGYAVSEELLMLETNIRQIERAKKYLVGKRQEEWV